MPSSLSVRISPAAQRTIKEAFEDLERSISAGDRQNLNTATLEDVRQAAHAIENQLAARQCLRNMRRLMPLFDGLAHYSKTIEVLCNGTPYLPWIWAPIKLILKVSSDYVEAFEKIISGYARIAEPLSRFTLFDQAFSKNVHVQQTLAIFYSDILRFHKEAYKFVRRSGWRVLYLSSWGRFERRFNGIIDDMKAHEDLVDKTANAVSISEAQARRNQLFERLAKDEEKLTTDHYLAVIGWLKINVCDQPKVFDSIASEAQDGTCNWVLRQPKIASFMRLSKESTFLVLRGHPGTGKSVLASQISAFLTTSGKSLVITHFCTYSYASSLEYDQILGSILNGLVRGNADLAAHAYQELIVKKKPPTPRILTQLLTDLVAAATLLPSQVRYIHIILDGLDECETGTQHEVIKLLERIVSETSRSGSVVCKVLASTRGAGPSTKQLKQKQNVSLLDERDAVDKAITVYTSTKLAGLSSRLMDLGITSEMTENLSSQIVKKADGMFLWARLVLDYLGTNLFVNSKEFLSAADRLPRELSDFYGQILTHILKGFDARSVGRTRLVLGWVAFAKRPLKKIEFRSALAFADGIPDVSRLAPEYILEACAPLVEQRGDSTFAFIHVSVKEFLQSGESDLSLDEITAHLDQGLAIATCLLSGLQRLMPSCPETSRNLRILSGIHAFQSYATEYWTEYLLFVASSADGIDTQSPFFMAFVQLACQLSILRPQKNHENSCNSSLDPRLRSLESYEELHQAVYYTLRERQIILDFYSDMNALEEPAIRADSEVTCPQSLLAFYQQSIRALINLRSHEEVTLHEFERFKQDFRAVGFNCRLWFCPRASTGFSSAEELLEHETSHSRLVCRAPECQYPPFTSERDLKKHQFNCHSKEKSEPKRASIRVQPRNQTSAQRLLADDSRSLTNISEDLPRATTFMEYRDTAQTSEIQATQKRISVSGDVSRLSTDVKQHVVGCNQQYYSSSSGVWDASHKTQNATELYAFSPSQLSRIPISASEVKALKYAQAVMEQIQKKSFSDLPIDSLGEILKAALSHIPTTTISYTTFWEYLLTGFRYMAAPEKLEGFQFWAMLFSLLQDLPQVSSRAIWEAFVSTFCQYDPLNLDRDRHLNRVWESFVVGMPIHVLYDPSFWSTVVKHILYDVLTAFTRLLSILGYTKVRLSHEDSEGIIGAMVVGVPSIYTHKDRLMLILNDARDRALRDQADTSPGIAS